MNGLQLPQPVHSYTIRDEGRKSDRRSLGGKIGSNGDFEKAKKSVPPYRKRQNFIPKLPEDFSDGGAFPEIHVAQFPLGMGKRGVTTETTLALTVDEKGDVEYDAIVVRNRGGRGDALGGSEMKLHTRYEDLVAKNSTAADNDALQVPTEAEKIEARERTAKALESIVGKKLEATRAIKFVDNSAASKSLAKPVYVAYQPQGKTGQISNSRVIRIVEAQEDPLDLPTMKHKKAPRSAPTESLAPVMHSTVAKATAQEKADWVIPPCISSWKNPQGFTIPLDKRLAADGRGLQDVQINDRFAGFSEALYVAENQAREEVEARNREKQHILKKSKEREEENLRELAGQVRRERAELFKSDIIPTSRRRARSSSSDSSGTANSSDTEPGKMTGPASGSRTSKSGVSLPKTKDLILDEASRENMRLERKREREKALRLEMAGKKSKISRDSDRDVSEKIALGMKVPQSAMIAGEAGFDSRLFNQSEGLSSGFGNDDEYNVYSTPLFNGAEKRGKTYLPKAGAQGMFENVHDELEKIKKKDLFVEEGEAFSPDVGAPLNNFDPLSRPKR